MKEAAPAKTKEGIFVKKLEYEGSFYGFKGTGD